METTELLEAVARGEDSRHQFKEDVTNATSLAAEIAAFAYSGGGQIFMGVADDGNINELDAISDLWTTLTTLTGVTALSMLTLSNLLACRAVGLKVVYF